MCHVIIIQAIRHLNKYNYIDLTAERLGAEGYTFVWTIASTEINPKPKYKAMKTRALEIRWGIYFILMQLFWMVLEKALGYHDERIAEHAGFSMWVSVPSMLMYFLALHFKRVKDYAGNMSLKQGLVSGLVITAVVTLLTPASQIITSLVITPDYFENAIAYAVESGAATQEAAEANFNLTSYLWQSVVFAPIAGLVTSLLMAALMLLFNKK